LPSLGVRTAQVFTVSLSWVRPKTNGVTPGHVSHPVTISFRVFTSYRAIPIARTRRLSSAIIPYAVLSKNSRMHWSAKILSGLYNSAISRVFKPGNAATAWDNSRCNMLHRAEKATAPSFCGAQDVVFHKFTSRKIVHLNAPKMPNGPGMNRIRPSFAVRSKSRTLASLKPFLRVHSDWAWEVAASDPMSATATSSTDAVSAGICPRQSFATLAFLPDDSTQKNRYGCMLKLGGAWRAASRIVRAVLGGHLRSLLSSQRNITGYRIYGPSAGVHSLRPRKSTCCGMIGTCGNSREWVAHYNKGRPHSGLDPGIPEPSEGIPVLEISGQRIPCGQQVVGNSVLGGLHHEYRLEPVVA